jgi:hypothetical protein
MTAAIPSLVELAARAATVAHVAVTQPVPAEVMQYLGQVASTDGLDRANQLSAEYVANMSAFAALDEAALADPEKLQEVLTAHEALRDLCPAARDDIAYAQSLVAQVTEVEWREYYNHQLVDADTQITELAVTIDQEIAELTSAIEELRQ